MIENGGLRTFMPHSEQRFVAYPIEGTYPYHRFVLPSTTDLLNQRQQSYIPVDMGKYAYSKTCMATFAQLYCDSIVLRSPKIPDYRGLGHILSGENPEGLFDPRLSRFPPMAPLEAMIIRSEGKTDTRLIEMCNAAGIKIVHFVEVPLRPNKKEYDYTALFKDVIVTPTRGEVILNIEEMGMQYFSF